MLVYQHLWVASSWGIIATVATLLILAKPGQKNLEGSEHRPCKQDQTQLHAKIHHDVDVKIHPNGFKQFNSHCWSYLQYHDWKVCQKCAKFLNGPDHLELLGTDDVKMRPLDDHQTTALQPAMIQDLLLRQVAESWQNPGSSCSRNTKHRCGTRHATRNSTPENWCLKDTSPLACRICISRNMLGPEAVTCTRDHQGPRGLWIYHEIADQRFRRKSARPANSLVGMGSWGGPHRQATCICIWSSRHPGSGDQLGKFHWAK